MSEVEVQNTQQQKISKDQISEQQVSESSIITEMRKESSSSMKKYMSILSSGPQDSYDEISQEDIQYLQKTKYKIALYPIFTFIGLSAVKKAVDFIRIPEILRNPLLPPKVNVERGKYFKTFMSKNILLIASVTSAMGGLAVYEVNKYYMYLKYKNLVESYLDACEKQYLNNLKEQGQQIDLSLPSYTPEQVLKSDMQEEH